MLLTNCDVNIFLPCSVNCFIVAGNVSNQVQIFITTDTRLYVPVVTLSTENNAKLLQERKSGFKSTINWNKYQLKATNNGDRRPLFRLFN